jgi:hypothetical protein
VVVVPCSLHFLQRHRDPLADADAHRDQGTVCFATL